MLAVNTTPARFVLCGRSIRRRDSHGLAEVRPDFLQYVHELRVDKYRIGAVSFTLKFAESSLWPSFALEYALIAIVYHPLKML